MITKYKAYTFRGKYHIGSPQKIQYAMKNQNDIGLLPNAERMKIDYSSQKEPCVIKFRGGLSKNSPQKAQDNFRT